MNKPIAFTDRLEALVLWVETLESGKKRQVTGALKGKVGDRYGFCCLGVACDLNAKVGGQKWNGESYLDENTTMPKRLQNFFGLSNHEVNTLITLNDDKKWSFKQIAEYIRTQVMPKALKRSDNYRAR
jgi:hypothetical protein